MKLPQAEKLLVEWEKVVGYLLNPGHRYGGSKAGFFAAFGFRGEQWEQLASALRDPGREHNVAREYETGFGPRNTIDGELSTPCGRCPRVRSVWQMDAGADAPRLITAYPLEAAE